MQEKIIEVKGRQAIALPKLVRELEEAFKDDWSLADDIQMNDCRMFSPNWFRIVLFKEDESIVVTDLTPEDTDTDIVTVETTTEDAATESGPGEEDGNAVETTEEVIVDPAEGKDTSVTANVEVEDGEVTSIEVVEDVSLLNELATLTKKKELLDFAKRVEIEIPEKVKQPAAIKAYLQKALTKD